MTRIQVLRPDRPAEAAAPVALAARERPEPDAVLTVIENGKPRARDLLRMLAEELRGAVAFGEVEIFSKPSAARPIGDDEARMLAARSRLVMTGLGD